MIQSPNIKELKSEKFCLSMWAGVHIKLPSSSGKVKMGDLSNSGKVWACQRVGGLGQPCQSYSFKRITEGGKWKVGVGFKTLAVDVCGDFPMLFWFNTCQPYLEVITLYGNCM